jgi:hypothetical protein
MVHLVSESADPEKNKGRWRPKGTLSEVADKIGINERRVFEVRQIGDVRRSLYQGVKAGIRSPYSALAEINPPQEPRSGAISFAMPGAVCQELDEHTQHELREFAQLRVGKVAQSTQKPASKEAAAGVTLPSTRPATLEKALGRIKAVLGNWFYAEVKARNLIQNPEDRCK